MFFKGVGLCGFLGVLTTVLLAVLPVSTADSDTVMVKSEHTGHNKSNNTINEKRGE
jgi:hypothetical protein